MTEITQYNQDNVPMADIMSEIRDMVSREAQARYDEERSEAKRELLILRPEARVDLLLQEPESGAGAGAGPEPSPGPEPGPQPSPSPPPPVTAQELESSLEAELFKARLREALGVGEPQELEALIRKLLREELRKTRP